MFRTEGLSTIATTTDLRNDSKSVFRALRSGGVLVQRNGQPRAVLLSFEMWKALRPYLDEAAEGEAAEGEAAEGEAAEGAAEPSSNGQH
jgi:prevent-host-death family protein